MSNLLEVQLRAHLHDIANGSRTIPDQLLKEFEEACTKGLIKQFHETYEGKFRARMSNIGRPLCQLLAEKYNLPKYPKEYNSITRNIWGDLTEQFVMLLLQSAGIKVQSSQVPVTLKIGKHTIAGTYDVEIYDKIWDIKSASDWAFKYKFSESGGFTKILEEDSFGYITQLYLYSEASGKDVGGWIVVNKSSGEINVIEFPEHDTYKKQLLSEVEKKLDILCLNPEFEKGFDTEPETYYGSLTGNYLLGFACSWCAHKKHCWPDAKLVPSVVSKAKTPALKWYNNIDSQYTERKI